MNFIKEKKINKWIMTALLYVGFCFAYFVTMRGSVALLALNYSLSAVFNNDIVAFILAGIFPILVYELVTSFAFKFARTRGVYKADDMRYALRFFFLPATIVMGSVKLIFMFKPLGLAFGTILTDLLVPLPFFALFLWYVLKTYADKTRYASLIYLLGGTFTAVYGVYALLMLLTEVLA